MGKSKPVPNELVEKAVAEGTTMPSLHGYWGLSQKQRSELENGREKELALRLSELARIERECGLGDDAILARQRFYGSSKCVSDIRKYASEVAVDEVRREYMVAIVRYLEYRALNLEARMRELAFHAEIPEYVIEQKRESVFILIIGYATGVALGVGVSPLLGVCVGFLTYTYMLEKNVHVNINIASLRVMGVIGARLFRDIGGGDEIWMRVRRSRNVFSKQELEAGKIVASLNVP